MFSLDIGKLFSQKEELNISRLSREVVEFPSLEVFKECVEVALHAMV